MFAGFVIFADHIKELARSDIIRGRLFPAALHIEPLDNGEAQGIGSLNDTAANGGKVTVDPAPWKEVERARRSSLVTSRVSPSRK